MIELKGKYATAKIYAETIEDGVFQQVYDIINSKAFENQKVAIMPDAHVGASGPVGLCSTIGNWVNPEHIGVDIGCSVSMIVLNKIVPVEKYADFEHKIKNALPFGQNINEKVIINEKDFFKFMTNGFNRYRQCWPEMLSDLPDVVTEKWVSEQLKRLHVDEGVFYKSVPSVGGGNHFVEYDENTSGDSKNYPAAVTFHFGSRKFGVNVCKYWTAETNNPVSKERIKELTKAVKEDFKKNNKDMRAVKDAIDAAIEAERSNFITGYLTGEKMKGYLRDMCFAQLYASYNHKMAHKAVADILMKYGIKVVKTITSVHNFIDLEDHILRKSSIRAYEGEEMLVPFNMRDGVAICEGLSNEDWLNSCAHGAGRKMSRSVAKKTITLDEFTETMKDVYSTTVNTSTIDEAPQAYKDTDEIKNLIQETCVIKCMMIPKINIKGSEIEKPWQK